MKSIVLSLRRQVLQRLTGEVVTTWRANSTAPSLSVEGRSLATIERRARKMLAGEITAETRFEWRLSGEAAETQQAIDDFQRAVAVLSNASDILERESERLVRHLLLENPSLSARDVARLTGLSLFRVQELAHQKPGAEGTVRQRVRRAQKQQAMTRQSNAAWFASRQRAREPEL